MFEMWLVPLVIAASIFNVSLGINSTDDSSFLVSIENEFGEHICTGIAISADKVITAASCLHLNPFDFKIRESISLDGHTRRRHSVSSICTRAKMDEQNAFANDIGIVRLSEPFEFSDRFSPIKLLDKLPENLEDAGYTKISGLGLNGEGTVVGIDATLHNGVNGTQCANVYGRLGNSSGQVTTGQICATWDTCVGYVGAPLFYKGKVAAFVSRWEQGVLCRETGASTILTSIPHHYNWIKAFLKDFEMNKDLAQWSNNSQAREPPTPTTTMPPSSTIEPWYNRLMNGLVGT